MVIIFHLLVRDRIGGVMVKEKEQRLVGSSCPRGPKAVFFRLAKFLLEALSILLVYILTKE
jgi:hypothetical protein